MADLRVLGPLEVVDTEGEPIKLSGARQRGLLALLGLSSPAMVSTDVIIESLWGADGIARPDAALHTTVNRLRKELGDAHVATEPGGYRLDIPTSNSDVSRFRALVRRGSQLMTLGHPLEAAEAYRQSLAQWRGPALADLREFEFAESAARGLEEERLLAVERLMDAIRTEGRRLRR